LPLDGACPIDLTRGLFGVWILGCLRTDFRRSDLRLFGSDWARQDFPSALRGLDPPGALPSFDALIGSTWPHDHRTVAHVGRKL